MAREQTVQVSFGAEHARYVIRDEGEGNLNGPMLTVGDAIARFTDGNGLAENVVARVDGVEANPEASLRDNDVIVIATQQSASGGYKGA